MLLSMSQKEISRIDVIRDVSDRRLRQKEAARLLSLTRRHIQRLVNAYRAEGPAGLVSIRRGKPSNRRHSSYNLTISVNDALPEKLGFIRDLD